MIDTAFTTEWEPIKSSLGQLRASQDSLEQFLDLLINDLEQCERHDATNDTVLRQQIESLAADRSGIENELGTAREEITRLSGIAVELANVRAELAESRAKGGRLRDQMASAAKVEQQLRSSLAEAEIERRSLDSELDILRRRCAELGDELSDHKRQISQERATWTTELKEWRRLFEKQSTLLAGSSPLAARRDQAPAAKTGRTQPDPVLGSVLAQFEMLQKDKPNRDANEASATSSDKPMK